MFRTIVAFTAALLSNLLPTAAQSAQPNIVFILSDDQGIDGVGCYGSDRFQGKTPNLDALAAAGLRFEQAFSMPSCNPSRCALMTGRYGFRTGNKPSFSNEPSVAKVLKQAGYATGMAGKWRQMADTPGDWGFDEYLTDPQASGYYWEKSYTKNGQSVTTQEPVYYPDVCLDFAVDFFQRHRQEPFYFYFPAHLIHNPIVRTPDSQADAKDPDALYEDNVVYLDKQVGKLAAALDKLGLRQRTVIVFAGDNGTSSKHAGNRMTLGGRQISGEKAGMLEGGCRVPLIANWPGTIAAGRVLRDLVDFTDFLPTFAALAGASLPTEVMIDGQSFAPQLLGKPGRPRQWVYVEHNTMPEWYVRDQGWKLTHRGELFDMSDAPFVEKPVAAEGASEAAAAARLRLQAVLDQLNPAAGQHALPADAAEKAKQKKKRKARAKTEAPSVPAAGPSTK